VVYGNPTRGVAAKDYLVANGNIEPDRIVVLSPRRRRNKPTIKLYVVPIGADPPHA